MKIDPQRWPDLSRLMDQMLDLPAGERAAWVRDLTGAEAEWAPQLLTLLQTGAASTSWMETLPKMGATGFKTVVDSGTGYEDVGDEVGPYRLVRLIARGGMGSVWYAERSDRLMRRGVALKLPLASSRSLAARFDREREIVASLVHPNIARLYDAGMSASGQAYLALEYVQGRSLDQYCDQNRLGVAARVALFAQVLSAVQYAHSRLVIHRDIKPSNILVTPEGEVRLLDFGIAKMLDTPTPEPSDLTRVADAGMTLAYASPEQVAGRPVTTATDIYSLGVVLFELLAGVRPHRVKRDSRAALEEAILEADIPLASAIAGGTDAPEEVAQARSTTLRRLRRELRGDIDAILLKALARKPQDRYETAAGFADDLERYRNGRVVRAHRRSRAYQLRKFVGRNRLPVGAALATAVLLTGATAVAVWQAREAGRERDRALAAEANRSAVNDFMADLLLEAGRTGKPISVPDLIARANELSARQFAANPDVRAAVLRSVGTLQLEFTGAANAMASFDQALAMVAGSTDLALRAGLQCDRALLQGILGEVAAAQRTLDQVAADPHTPLAAASLCLGNRAQLANYFRDGAVGASAARAALSLLDRAPNPSQIRRLELLSFLANANYLNGEPAKAEAGLTQVMDDLRKIGRERGELAHTVQGYRINAAYSSGDPRLALQLVDELIATLALDLPGQPPPAVLLLQRSLALTDLGRNEEALAGYGAIARTGGTQDDAIKVRALLGAARSLSRLGHPDAAEKAYQDALDLRGRAHLEADDDIDIERLLARTHMDVQARRFKLAKSALDDALGASGPQHPVAGIRRLRAIAELNLGDTQSALEDMQVATVLYEKERGDKPYSLDVGLTELGLGQVHAARGNPEAARHALARAVDQIDLCCGPDHPDGRFARSLLQGIERQISQRRAGS